MDRTLERLRLAGLFGRDVLTDELRKRSRRLEQGEVMLVALSDALPVDYLITQDVRDGMQRMMLRAQEEGGVPEVGVVTASGLVHYLELSHADEGGTPSLPS